MKTILEFRTTDSPPTKEVMTNFWQNVMTKDVDQALVFEYKWPLISELWKSISFGKIKKSFPDLRTSPGPDGITTHQLKTVLLKMITRMFNLFLICGKLPQHLFKAKTTFIPKKDAARERSHYCPITSVRIIRAFRKVLATRLTNLVVLKSRHKAFLPKDECSEKVFNFDLTLKYHRQQFKPLYMAPIDLAKAFDSVSHKTIKETLQTKGLPELMVSYVMDSYHRSPTHLTC